MEKVREIEAGGGGSGAASNAASRRSGRQHPARKAGVPDWHDYLLSSERHDLDALEANAQRLDGRRRAITRELTLIRNRCLKRRQTALGGSGA